ncbi:MAG: alginate lyase family protein [Myxococcales bacterium]|nr:heparinase II/III family protein [Myxococcales bacterium]
MDLSYYSYLAQTIPPRELARALAVRARRAVVSRLRPLISDAPAEQRRARALYALTESRPSVVEPWEREPTARLLRERWPESCAAVLREAEAARRGVLTIFGRSIECGSPIDYHRDPLAPHVRYDAQEPGERVDLFRPGADAKAMWEVGRLQHLWRFAQARWLAETIGERSEWARAWIDAVRHFRAANPAGFGVQWSCAMEVSLRAMNVALTFAYVRDDAALDGTFTGELLDMLDEHCAYVESHLEETGAIRTNHYAADLVGLVVVGALFPEVQRRWALEKLWEEIPRQCRQDGTHFESSTGYQRLCAELFLAAVLAVRATGETVPREILTAVRGLHRSLALTLKPSGAMPQIGDLDSCRGLPLVPRSALDASFLAPLGAAALDDPSLKAGECPPEVAWLLGPDGVRTFDLLEDDARPGNVLLRDAGIAVLRSGDAWLCMSAGPNGQGGTGGHAHNDKNSVELSIGATDLVVDRGTFVYARDASERNARRGTAGHSTVQIDGLEQNRIVPGRLFALPDTAGAQILRVERRDGFELATGSHTGYRSVGVTHRRIAALSADAAAFVDELRGRGEHRLTLRWYVPRTDLVQRAATPEEALRLEKLHDAGLAFGYDTSRCVAVGDVALFAFGATLPWQLSVTATDVSPGYGEKVFARLIALDFAGSVPARLFTAVLFLHAQ